MFPSSRLLASFLVISCALISVSSPAEEPKPNFIVINIDDLGYADVGPFGSTLNRTPNLDRMATEGMKLKCHYAAPVCSPSRSALMTGCYPKRVLPIPGVLFPSAAVGVNPNERTVAEVLKEQGYATACIGKWHLGDQAPFLPTAQGFDHYLGIPYSNDMGTAEEGSKSDLNAPLPNRKNTPPTGEIPETGLGGANQPPLPLVQDGKVIDRLGPDGQQGIVKRYTEAALKFIREQKDHRFFLYLPHNAVHFPIYPGKEFVGKSKNGIFGDWVEEVDWSVGQVLDLVRELKLDSNTLVIFTSDNGGTPRSVNAPLRGFKASTWEGGMRVPTIAWCPGKVPANTSTDEITSMMDILPTFAAMSGGKLPERKIDGGNIWPLLSGQTGAKSPHSDVFYFYLGLKLEAIRSGPWKLRFAQANPNAKKGKKALQGDGTLSLFNLEQDIGETKNVAAEHPEEVARLQKLAEAMKGDLDLDGKGPGCHELGRVEHPEPFIHHDGSIRADAK